jgi:integrase
MAKKTPAYRQKSEREIAVVTLADAKTMRRREFSLGRFDSPESRELYHRLIAEWESGGRRLPTLKKQGLQDDALTVSALCLAYWLWAKGYYSASSLESIRTSLRFIRKHHGSSVASSIGPNAMRAMRESMIREPYGWSRSYANDQTACIKRMFKWAASREMIEVQVYESLRTLESLKQGRTSAKEPNRVTPVDVAVVEQTLPHLSRQVSAMIQLQLSTAARPSEIITMRPCDLDRSADTWIYIPQTHKMAHMGKSRVIYIGPRGQRVLIPFLQRELDAYIFSPIEAEEERRAKAELARVVPKNYGNTRGSTKVENPKRAPGELYNRNSYRRAIERACRRAFPCPEELHGDARKQWHKDHRWHPYQLRHTAATLIRAQQRA